MKRIAAALVTALTVFSVVGAGSSSSGSGLRGTVLLEPASPTCQPGTSCTRPAAHALLRFWHDGRVVAHIRTDGKGRFRIALRPRTYRVTSLSSTVLKPTHATVATGRYRWVTFRLDSGIR